MKMINPLTGSYSYEGIRLEMLIRTTLNEQWASTANNVYDALRYVKRAQNTRHAHSLHYDEDTTANWQLIETHIDPSDLTEL